MKNKIATMIGFKELLLIALIILLLFGAGKLPTVMKDLGRGLRNFKKGVNDADDQQKDEEKGK